jgi:hypothetical protein
MRSLNDILCHPRDDLEERIANEHIRRAAAEVRRNWHEHVHRERAGLAPVPDPWFPAVVVDPDPFGQRLAR